MKHQGEGPVAEDRHARALPREFAAWLLTPRGPLLLGVGYALALLLGAAVLHAQPADRAVAWRAWASTDLDNLSDPLHGPAALVVSAFVVEDDPTPWAMIGVVALWAAGRTLGARRALGLVAAVHVLATLFSEAVLLLRIDAGLEPVSARGILDIGASYVVVSALVTGIVYGRGAARIACAGGFVVVAPSLFEGLDRLDVAAVGHAVTIVLAGLIGFLVRPGRRAG